MDNANKKNALKVGEIFEYEIQNEGEVDKNRAFFIKVGNFYYLIDIDVDSCEYSHYEEISGMNFKERKREGKDPFSFQEVMEYLKTRKVKPTGKMLVPAKVVEKKTANTYTIKDENNTW